MKPMPAQPKIIIAQVEGAGTTEFEVRASIVIHKKIKVRYRHPVKSPSPVRV
jgi:hypothetical protein